MVAWSGKIGLFLAVSAAVACAAALDVAAAATASPVVRRIEWDAFQSLPVDDMMEADALSECTPVPIRFETAAFSFAESATQNGCAEARFTLNNSAGAREAVLRFSADRRMESFGGVLPSSASFRQRLFYYDDAMRVMEEQVLFSTTAEAQPSTPFERRFVLPATAANVTWGWLFQELSGGTGSSLSSTVTNATLHLVDLDVVPLPETVVSETVVEQLRTTTTRVGFTLGPDWAGDPLGSLRVTVNSDQNLTAASSTDGVPLDTSRIDRILSRGALTYRLPNDLFAPAGGSYALEFEHSAAVPATPVVPPTTFPPAAWAALAAPLIALPFATRAGVRYWREAHGAARGVGLAGAGLVAVLYGIVLAIVLRGGFYAKMVRWPWTPEAFLLYAILLGLTLAGVGVWIVIGRVLVGSLRRELDERRRLVEELQRSNSDLQQFAYVASHDLQEPLRTITSYLQLLQRRLGDGLDEDAGEFLTYARDGAARMRDLIQGLLEYSRVQTHSTAWESVDLQNVWTDVRARLDAAIRDSDAKLVVGNLPTVVGDRSQLGALLQNLVANAIKFTPTGRRPNVRLEARRDADAWRVEVEDNGIGIAPEFRERLFVIFQRLHRRDQYAGTGIGLALCKRIVERRGGHIGFDSSPGKGSLFWFTIPDATPTVNRPSHVATVTPGPKREASTA